MADIGSWLCILAGSVFLLAGGIGILRLPDFFTRIHAAGITDTVAAWLIVTGLALQAGLSQVTLKLGLIVVFIVITSPTATHALAKAALHRGLRPITQDQPTPERED